MSRVTTNSGKGYRHNRRPQPQIDLFGSGRQTTPSARRHGWSCRRKPGRSLTSLMARLILDHAATTATPPAKEAGHDL